MWKNEKQFFHTSLQNAAAFRTVPTGPTTAINPQKDTNKNGTLHLLPKPDIFICYRHRIQERKAPQLKEATMKTIG